MVSNLRPTFETRKEKCYENPETELLGECLMTEAMTLVKECNQNLN